MIEMPDPKKMHDYETNYHLRNVSMGKLIAHYEAFKWQWKYRGPL